MGLFFNDNMVTLHRCQGKVPPHGGNTMTRFFAITLLTAITSLITACSLMQNTADDNHKAICKELKRRIVFNAATGNNTKATQQRGELNQLNKNYNAQGC